MIFRKLIKQIKHPPHKNAKFFNSYYNELKKKNLFIYNKLNMSTISTDNTDNVEDNKIVRKKHNQNIIDKLTSSNVDMNDVPQDCLSRRKEPTFLYLLNREGAKQYASIIAPDLLTNNVPVMEICPGLGFLTEELLKAGVSQIFMYEKAPEFVKVLENLLIEYPGRVDLRQLKLLSLPQIAYIDYKIGSDNLGQVFKGIKQRSDDKKPTMQIIGVMPNTTLLTCLSLPYTSVSLEFNHIVFYTIIYPSTSWIFQDIPDNIFHKPKNIFFRTKYDYKFLHEFPREYFFPNSLPTLRRKKNIQYYLDDLKKMYLVKIESKKNSITDKFTQLDWYYFLSFLQMCMTRRQTRIIPTLEKWIPGCGPSLIKHNFDIYSRFSALTSPELLDLFNIFRAMPEFKTSSFVSIMQSHKQNLMSVDPAVENIPKSNN